MGLRFISLVYSLPLFSLTTSAFIIRDNVIGGKVWDGIPGRNDNPFQLADYVPNGFAPAYNVSYCPKDSAQVNVPPIIAYYPFQPSEVCDVISDIFNTSWVLPNPGATNTGQDNVPDSALRHEPIDPNAEDLLVSYYKGNNPPYGFYHQQVAQLYRPTLVAPGLKQVDGRATIILRPGCDNRAAQFGWYYTYCFATDETTAPANFNLNGAGNAWVANEAVKTKQTEPRLLDLLEQYHPTRPKSTFNATNGCAGVPLR